MRHAKPACRCLDVNRPTRRGGWGGARHRLRNPQVQASAGHHQPVLSWNGSWQTKWPCEATCRQTAPAARHGAELSRHKIARRRAPHCKQTGVWTLNHVSIQRRRRPSKAAAGQPKHHAARGCLGGPPRANADRAARLVGCAAANARGERGRPLTRPLSPLASSTPPRSPSPRRHPPLFCCNLSTCTFCLFCCAGWPPPTATSWRASNAWRRFSRARAAARCGGGPLMQSSAAARPSGGAAASPTATTF